MSNPISAGDKSCGGGPLRADGMTLRDYFAAKAMQAFISQDKWSTRLMAESAYQMADSMIEARREKR